MKGSVVAIGGRVARAPGARVSGSVVSLPEIKIPFLGGLATRFSIQSLELGREIIGYFLYGLALLLLSYYLPGHQRRLCDSIPGSWRATLLTLALSLVIMPLGVILLVASVVGVFMLPAIALLLAVLSLDGFLAVCARIGAVLRGVKGRGSDASPLFLFTSGLLGLFLLKLPSLCGIFLTLFSAPAASTAGEILRVTSLAAMAAAFLYGLGSALSHARQSALSHARQSARA